MSLMVAFFTMTTGFRMTLANTPVNVLLILVDDLGYGDLSVTGNPYLKTPNIDFLAKHGVSFKNFYVSPVCAPTRASLLTGKYHQRVGVQSVTNGYEVLNPEEVTLAELLSSNNYRTAIFGKWHLGEYYPSIPLAQGFDYFCGFRTGHTDEYFDPQLEVNNKSRKFTGFITDILTDQAIEFITARQNDPFFCYLAYNAPHTPLQVDSSYFLPFIKNGLDERTARVYGLIRNLDENIGRILKVLTEQDLEKETLVIFMSDNGPISGWKVPQNEMRFNAGLRDQKFTVYDGGIRTACFWYAPGYLPQKEVAEVAAHIDVLPTIVDMLKIEDRDASSRDGHSLLPAIFGEATRHYFFQKYGLNSLGDSAAFPGGIVRDGHWKMVDGVELYDLGVDPGEKNNLYLKFPDKSAKLKEVYLDWWSSILRSNSLEKKPISIGYKVAPEAFLQPHHATASGTLRFEGKRGLTGERLGYHPSGVDGDWVVGWEQNGDRLTWDVEVVEESSFLFEIIGENWLSKKRDIQLIIDGARYPISDSLEDEEKTVFNPVLLSKGMHHISLEIITDGDSGRSSIGSASCPSTLIINTIL